MDHPMVIEVKTCLVAIWTRFPRFPGHTRSQESWWNDVTCIFFMIQPFMSHRSLHHVVLWYFFLWIFMVCFFKISPPIEVRCFHLKQLGTEAEAPLPDARGRQMWHREARWWGAGAELRADFPYNGGFLQWGYPNSWMVYNGLYIYII